TAMALRIWCLVDGQASSQAFSVVIDASATIEDLKERIMEKITDTFKGNAKDLTLRCGSIPNLDEPPPEATLDARDTLGSVYPQGQGRNDYIIVQLPQS
ncbi:hypothetical protein BGX34_008889, partial [Mortierella sp. NVP85]